MSFLGKTRLHQFEISPQDAQVFVVASTVYGHGRPRVEWSSRFFKPMHQCLSFLFYNYNICKYQYPWLSMEGLFHYFKFIAYMDRFPRYSPLTLSNHVELVSALSLIDTKSHPSDGRKKGYFFWLERE